MPRRPALLRTKKKVLEVAPAPALCSSPFEEWLSIFNYLDKCWATQVPFILQEFLSFLSILFFASFSSIFFSQLFHLHKLCCISWKALLFSRMWIFLSPYYSAKRSVFGGKGTLDSSFKIQKDLQKKKERKGPVLLPFSCSDYDDWVVCTQVDGSLWTEILLINPIIVSCKIQFRLFFFFNNSSLGLI